ncbi:hypothetical protein ACFVXG_24375 [Kitasatospora sp. NPDC058162]|uniref:hypothetical protein n=1 Tax=Kitasatospora sp. NPDC058162 TaxID=3346362 RepID=UPI0036DED68E
MEDEMHPAVEELVGLMPPHDGSGDVVDWSSIEELFGVVLPSDFRDFIAVYGAGVIDDQLEIASPTGEESGGADMLAMTPRVSSLRWLEESGSGYPLWPESGSLICWGRLKSYGETYGFLYWRSVGTDADRWPVVLWRRDRQGFVEHPGGMAEFLVRLLRESCSLPLDRRDLFGFPHSRFINWREEARLSSENIDPWQYLEDLHEELDDLDNDIAVEVAGPGGESVAYRRGEVPIDVAAQVAQLKDYTMVDGRESLFADARPMESVADVPQMVFLGVLLRGGDLWIRGSIALGLSDFEPLRLSVPLCLSVRILDSRGEVASSMDAVNVNFDPLITSGKIEITKHRPFAFSVNVPAPELLWGEGRPIADADAGRGGFSVAMSLTDEGVGAFRARAGVAAAVGSENTLIGSWPPGT